MRAQSLRWLKTAILGLCNTRLFVQYASWKRFYFSFFSGIWGNRGILRCPSWGVGTTHLPERRCPRRMLPLQDWTWSQKKEGSFWCWQKAMPQDWLPKGHHSVVPRSPAGGLGLDRFWEATLNPCGWQESGSAGILVLSHLPALCFWWEVSLAPQGWGRKVNDSYGWAKSRLKSLFPTACLKFKSKFKTIGNSELLRKSTHKFKCLLYLNNRIRNSNSIVY